MGWDGQGGMEKCEGCEENGKERRDEGTQTEGNRKDSFSGEQSEEEQVMRALVQS